MELGDDYILDLQSKSSLSNCELVDSKCLYTCNADIIIIILKNTGT